MQQSGHLIGVCVCAQDISPEDLFPPVSFTINDRADEDMPYTDPSAKPESEVRMASAASPKCVFKSLSCKHGPFFL